MVIISFVTFSADKIKNDIINHYKASINLNVRTGAGKKHLIYFTLKNGDKVELIETKTN